ncbi:MAG: hypothetical protein U5K55_07350 [Aliarcobacter sp.]|nr:hypothetical protein [Aliarcobacter sp.]
MNNDLLIYILTPILIAIFVIIAVLLLIERKEQQKNIILLSQFDNKAIIDQQKSKKSHDNDFTMKLIQAGITYKEYTEARLLFALIGIIIISVLPFFFSLTVGIICYCCWTYFYYFWWRNLFKYCKS